MSLIDKIKNAFAGGEDKELSKEFDAIIKKVFKEMEAHGTGYWSVKVNQVTTFTSEIKLWDDKKKIDFVVDCVKKSNIFHRKHNRYSYEDYGYQICNIRERFVDYLMKTKIIYEDVDVQRLVRTFKNNERHNHADIIAWPIAYFTNQVVKQYKNKTLSPIMIAALEELLASLEAVDRHYYRKTKAKLLDKIDGLLFQAKNGVVEVRPVLFSGEGRFSAFANKMIEGLTTEDKKKWYPLIAQAQKASGGKPSKKYLKESKVLIDALGTEKFKAVVNDWFLFVRNLKDKNEEHTSTHNGRVYTYNIREFLNSFSSDALKGFVWMCSHFHDATTIQNLAALAERCYKKIPGKGPAAAAIGNACLYTLSQAEGFEGISQLSRLKLRIKQSSTQKMIEKYLLAAAKEQGVSLHEIEDLAVESFGIVDGGKTELFDDYKGLIKITSIGKSTLQWVKPDGKLQKSVPAFVKQKYADKLKVFKAQKKQIEKTLTAQRDRIDRMFRANRTWNMDTFTKLYLQHGLMQYLAKKIIWTFTFEDEAQHLIWKAEAWVNNDGTTITPHPESTISLWHPAIHPVAAVKKWRAFLMAQEIQQPLKQAYREVYILTAAEINTKSYSNRMAAHVLKQHQFNMLAKTRGWKYSLMGAFDDGRYNEAAELLLPAYNLRAEYWVNELNVEDGYNDTGIWLYIATDQVRFIDVANNEVLDLVDVPTIPFSEVLRDVDLFVGVASVGNDPAWQDTGGIPAYRDYWQSYSFGDLTEVAKNRKEVLSNLVPRLKINKVTQIKDKFLVVQGKLRTYKIHIGSTNILMEPNDEYLCIVPDRSKKNHTENLFIPFEGDNGLSIILSKAFLLANDDKITDGTITSQILRK